MAYLPLFTYHGTGVFTYIWLNFMVNHGKCTSPVDGMDTPNSSHLKRPTANSLHRYPYFQIAKKLTDMENIERHQPNLPNDSM